MSHLTIISIEKMF